jgi:hypothetical protein
VVTAAGGEARKPAVLIGSWSLVVGGARCADLDVLPRAGR